MSISLVDAIRFQQDRSGSGAEPSILPQDILGVYTDLRLDGTLLYGKKSDGKGNLVDAAILDFSEGSVGAQFSRVTELPTLSGASNQTFYSLEGIGAPYTDGIYITNSTKTKWVVLVFADNAVEDFIKNIWITQSGQVLQTQTNQSIILG